jgi:hypothetical protein
MPPVGFEPTIPASARPQTYALDRAATGIGTRGNMHLKISAECMNSQITREFNKSFVRLHCIKLFSYICCHFIPCWGEKLLEVQSFLLKRLNYCIKLDE